MTVQRRKDDRVPRVFQHKIADIRGGVSVKVAELGSDYLREGTVLSAPDGGICHVVKTAVLTAQAAADATSIQVKKGHQFKKDDFVLLKENDKASKISAIDTTNKDYDTLTLAAALGTIAKLGDCIAEAKAASTTTTSELKYKPVAVVGTGKPVRQGDNLDTDAWVIGVTKGNALPPCVADKLKGIINL